MEFETVVQNIVDILHFYDKEQECTDTDIRNVLKSAYIKWEKEASGGNPKA